MIVKEILIGSRRRRAFVLDGVIAPRQRSDVFAYFRHLPYYLVDESDGRTSVRRWIHPFREEGHDRKQRPAHPVLTLFQEIVSSFLADRKVKIKTTESICADLSLYGDLQFPRYSKSAWTALAFLNDSWPADWRGEQFLYADADLSRPGHAILPKPGRMVIFDGKLLHRRGVPAKFCLEPRISLTMDFGTG